MTAIMRWWRARQRCLVCRRQRRSHLDWFHGPILATYDDFVSAVGLENGREVQ